ncbi:tyrosine-type recombinase/integrase [Sphingosinicella microcystinivorans]|uniref:tyrosine-type recombinase/integrase n=1 Tax=Sphingosinicella microcystinivorans TaxID=335406 RepID=UPI0022F3E78E|nr:tyrosine-type recombinase/integrase [Sphingosinicella microcystinivorans]WBX84685.1 tyrosine-type recombinase/integrase [Sphingosinicella microcystinivorans]
MTRLMLKYIQAFRDRFGKQRYYFRKPGCKRIALPGLPGSTEFMEAYQAALEGTPKEANARIKPGTFNSLIASYYSSADYRTLSDATRRTYRNIIENFRESKPNGGGSKYGDRNVAALEPHHIRAMLDAKADTPAAANNLLRMLRMLMRFAVERNIRRDDPTLHVRKIRSASTGFHSWTEEEIAKFEACHKLGSRARLAMALLLYTAQRRSDVVSMGRQHVRDGTISVCQHKTKARLQIPIHPELRRVLDATESGNMTFIVSAHGKPFTPESFTNWFRDCVQDAGLPLGRSPHGLRKAASRRLAEAGCTPHQIMAITGHKTLKEVVRYTAAANQAQLARDAIAAIGGGETATKIVKLES